MDPSDWKKIQEKTFTRWVNQQLKKRDVAVTDLSSDFKDGVLLIALMETLSSKTVGKYKAKPRLSVQEMENLQKVLSFIEKEEGIRLVNIGKSVMHAPFTEYS